MKEWSRKTTLRETLGEAEAWPGEAYFDGDQHRLVLKIRKRRSAEKHLTHLAVEAQRASSDIIELVRKIGEAESAA